MTKQPRGFSPKPGRKPRIRTIKPKDRLAYITKRSRDLSVAPDTEPEPDGYEVHDEADSLFDDPRKL